jgi:hypothetical protein
VSEERLASHPRYRELRGEYEAWCRESDRPTPAAGHFLEPVHRERFAWFVAGWESCEQRRGLRDAPNGPPRRALSTDR